MSRRLLILACSQRKRPDPGLLPAIERYDGPQFQVLRKFVREYPDEGQPQGTYILSAKFGLIPADESIPNYDHKMTPKRAQALNVQVLDSISQILRDNVDCQGLFINLGESYWQALDGYERVIPSDLKIIISHGSQGRRQVELRDWLYSGLSEPPITPTTKVNGGKVRLRGIEIDYSPDQIYQLACVKLVEDPQGAASYHAWYVQIDDQQIAPKWLVSQLTGLPVGYFHSGEARRVLQQLGIEVRRV